MYGYAMEQSILWCVSVCESSYHGDVVGHPVTFYAIASLFSEVTTDSRPKCDKSSSVYVCFQMLSNLVYHD